VAIQRLRFGVPNVTGLPWHALKIVALLNLTAAHASQ